MDKQNATRPICPNAGLMIYSPEIESRFRNPQYACDAVAPDALPGRATTPGSAAVLHLYLKLERSSIQRAAFQAFGCPSTIAAADWACEWLTGRCVGEANNLCATMIESALELAPAKRHIGLLVEDALAQALAQMREPAIAGNSR